MTDHVLAHPIADHCSFCTHLLLSHNSAADGSPCLVKLCDCGSFTEHPLPPVPAPGLVSELLTAAAAQSPAPSAAERPICGDTAELGKSRGTITCRKAPHTGPWHRSGKTTWKYKTIPVFGTHVHKTPPSTT